MGQAKRRKEKLGENYGKTPNKQWQAKKENRRPTAVYDEDPITIELDPMAGFALWYYDGKILSPCSDLCMFEGASQREGIRDLLEGKDYIGWIGANVIECEIAGFGNYWTEVAERIVRMGAAVYK